ncbi:MAG: ABC transporter permease [Flavobacteriales bacterium]|nr:ABC transporter permease [Flavobacteriales bacterium]
MGSTLTNKEKDWDLVIEPVSSSMQALRISQIWKYRDLISLFVHRDFVAVYKQTILGPIWFFLQPILTTIIFTVVFGTAAKLSTDGLPKPVFYMSGIVLWNYFSEVLLKSSETFIAYRYIFAKVYFPRLVVPISIVFSNMLKLGVQLILFFAVYLYYCITTDLIEPTWHLLLIPLLIVPIALMGMGCGLLVAALTVKFRDLKFMVNFAVDLLKYVSPIIFPLSMIDGTLQTLILLNPMSAIIETFRVLCFGQGEFEWIYLASSLGMTFVLLAVGLFYFAKAEKTFIDTV